MSGNTFPGQHSNEHLIFFFRKHWTELFYPLAKFMIEQFIMGVIVLFMFFQGKAFSHTMEGIIMTIVIVVAITLSILKVWIRIFNYFLRTILVTNYRIVDVQQKLFIVRDEESIDYKDVQDMRVETHGIFRNFIQCGILTFIPTSGLPKVLHNVPRPEWIYTEITQIREKSKTFNGTTPVNDSKEKNL